jgi:microcystin-dependent protein
MAQPYVGEIRMFAGNFAPAGWMFCAGQLLPISENETLFQLIGTTYGGDGQSTFALPDLRGRLPIHFGNGFILAETGGAEQITLTVPQIPAHSHGFLASGDVANSLNPAGHSAGAAVRAEHRRQPAAPQPATVSLHRLHHLALWDFSISDLTKGIPHG